jgi:hypothetical protein
MDSKYLIQRDNDAQVAGFEHIKDGELVHIWCAECAIKDSETPPFDSKSVETSLPEIESIDGSISPVLYIYNYPESAGFTDECNNRTADLTEVVCSECSQTLHPS